MYNILDKIDCPKDVKALSKDDRKILCSEIRDFLIEKVINTGGHLASNLGVVELTVALHTVYDLPKDKIVWDVGHQSYVHKLLTGRRDRFDSLRQFEGLSGFPKTQESEYDCFNTGHSSTSVSAGLGMARARDLKGTDENIVCVFGDGAMTGGMIYEALNDLGHHKTPLVLILNDNEMSISKNVGALSKYLGHLRQTKSYHASKDKVSKILSRTKPTAKILDWLRKIKRSIRAAFVPSTFFDDLGIEYLGTVDGHDIESLIDVITVAKEMSEPVLVHVITKKGKGFLPAEKNPSKFHGISSMEDYLLKTKKTVDYSQTAGKTLIELAKDNEKIVAVTAAMPQGVGFSEFAKTYPDRFFDVGIAEQHAVTFCCGLAISGFVPVFGVYSSFLQRGYDQMISDCCLQNLHIVFLVDRAGVVGSDGETHHGIFDISYLCTMPNMTVLAPACYNELSEMIKYAVNELDGPVAIRYPRGKETLQTDVSLSETFINTFGENSENIIITFGRFLNSALLAQQELKNVKVVEVQRINPLPLKLLSEIKNAKNILTIEDNAKNGGFGEIISSKLKENKICANIRNMSFPTDSVCGGKISQIDKKYNMTTEDIVKNMKELING